MIPQTIWSRPSAAPRQAAEGHDLIITSGGVSVGEEDHLRKCRALAEGGLEFWALGDQTW